MRLGDLDFLKNYISDIKTAGGNKHYKQGIDDALQRLFPQIIDDQPTIDPESLPIVQELKEENIKLKEDLQDTFALYLMGVLDRVEKQLEQVTKERDMAVSDMQNFSIDWWENNTRFPCKYCEYNLPDGKCKWKMEHKNHNGCLSYNFKWRGIQEVENDTV